MKSFTHLSLDDRIQIQSCLGSHLSFKKIAALIHRDCTTISKEVRNHRTVVNSPRPYGKNNNRCQYATSCDRHHVCCRCTARRDERCSRCRVQNCNSVCPDFLENHCARLSRAPYVCNGCPIRNRCPLEKQFYYARDADAEYSRTLSDSRKGVDLTQAEIDDLNRLLQACIGKNKQSPYHVYISHRDMFNCSLRTLYNYINLGILNVKPIDLPRATRRKPRKTKSRTHKVDARCREGRSYTDYLSYMEKHPNSRVCQLDSVIGRKGGSCILTLCFPDIRFQFGYLRKRNDARSVRDFFIKQYHTLDHDLFHKLFDVLLVDNGSEFSDPSAIEALGSTEIHPRVFYCDPNRSDQKGACENDHINFRRIVPKGTDMDGFDQELIDRIFSQINNFCRFSLNGKTPFAMFRFLYGDVPLKAWNIQYVEPDDVVLSPALIADHRSKGEDHHDDAHDKK